MNNKNKNIVKIFETAYKKGCFSIRLEDEAKPYTEIYFGMASCYEFCAMVKLC